MLVRPKSFTGFTAATVEDLPELTGCPDEEVLQGQLGFQWVLQYSRRNNLQGRRTAHDAKPERIKKVALEIFKSGLCHYDSSVNSLSYKGKQGHFIILLEIHKDVLTGFVY